MKSKIHQLIETSKEVILDCCLENGAIVASNTDKDYYSKNVGSYRYVWPRDAAFLLYAANLLNIKNIQKPFIKWLLNRAENFSETGMLFQRYTTNGAKDPYLGFQYQPDQAGALLWALLEIYKKLDDDVERTVRLLANGLCKNWDGKCFKTSTYDLWEGRQTFPSLEDNFIYTLATCSFGLYQVYEKLGNDKWLKVSKEMKSVLRRSGKDYYPRLWGKLPDKRIDASVLGLVWPFRVVDRDRKLLNSIKLVKEKLLIPQGIKRYEDDEYDGRIENLSLWQKGAGGWSLLTFWYIIALLKTNKKEEAKQLFNNYLKRFKNNYIPEQLFDNKIQVSASPLCWSHSMFIIASKELGYL